jgi:alpha-amylase
LWIRWITVIFVVGMFVCGSAQQTAPAQAQSTPRTAFVHLFEWKWADIAKECENYLGPKGFAAVQVSPPNEHAIIRQANDNYPWWERYQPVGYSIAQSRSGTASEFQNMVTRCRNVGVDIYVDAVINHMTGGGGSSFDGTYYHGSNGAPYTKYTYPGTYADWDFHYQQHLSHRQQHAELLQPDAGRRLGLRASLATDRQYGRVPQLHCVELEHQQLVG